MTKSQSSPETTTLIWMHVPGNRVRVGIKFLFLLFRIIPIRPDYLARVRR